MNNLSSRTNDPSPHSTAKLGGLGVRKGAGSIRISGRVLDVLTAEATTQQIVTYFVLARFTDPSGTYSSAGRQALKDYLGIGDKQADLAIAELLTLTAGGSGGYMPGRQLVYTAEDWIQKSGEAKRQAKSASAQTRYYLDQLLNKNGDEEFVWFSNELVDGYGQFGRPLKRLKRLGDTAVRLLLCLYKENDMEQFGGVPPFYFSRRYDVAAIEKIDSFHLWHCTPTGDFAVSPMLGNSTLRVKAFNPNDHENPQYLDVISALQGLEAAGFVYEMVTIFDGSLGANANVVYELDMRGRHGYKPKGEEGLGGLTARIAGYAGHSVANVRAEFSGKYAAIVEINVRPTVAGIFRLRFRVSNPKNYTISASFARIHRDQEEWSETLNYLLAYALRKRNEREDLLLEGDDGN